MTKLTSLAFLLKKVMRCNFRSLPDKLMVMRNYGFLKDVSVVIHVGANTGQETELYNIYGLNVIWIEPIPEVFSSLQENIKKNKKQIAIQSLVADIDNKNYQFHVANNNGQSSSMLPLKQHKDIWPHVSYDKILSMNSTTLPSLCKKEFIDICQYQALIIDTQGSELLVLQGAIPMLKYFKYIMVEVPDFESYEGCCQLSDIENFMIQHEYQEFSRRKFNTIANDKNYFDIVYKTIN